MSPNLQAQRPFAARSDVQTLQGRRQRRPFVNAVRQVHAEVRKRYRTGQRRVHCGIGWLFGIQDANRERSDRRGTVLNPDGLFGEHGSVIEARAHIERHANRSAVGRSDFVHDLGFRDTVEKSVIQDQQPGLRLRRDPTEFRIYRLANKIDAGADFIQTQCIYNMPRFREFMKRAVDMGLTEKAYILAGVTPMKSARMAQYMAKNVPGMDVPDELIKRIEGAGKGKMAEEGIKFACEQIEEFKQMEGVAGVHLMAIEWEHKVPEIAERAQVLPRPKVE